MRVNEFLVPPRNKTGRSLFSALPVVTTFQSELRGKMKTKTVEKTATCRLFVVRRNHLCLFIFVGNFMKKNEKSSQISSQQSAVTLQSAPT